MTAYDRLTGVLREARDGRPISKVEARFLLSYAEDSLEAAIVRDTANSVSRRKFGNGALLLGQIGVDMAPCEGGCAFCFFAKSHTAVRPELLATEEIIARCHRYAAGGAQGVFLMTMHGDSCIDRLSGDETRAYRDAGCVVRGEVTEGGRVYTAYNSPEYMRNVFLKGLRILEFIPGGANAQDVWIVGT